MHINLFLTRYTVAILTLTFQYYITHLTIPSTHASTLYLPPSDIQHTFNTLLSLHSSDSYFKTFLIHSPDPPTSNTPTFFILPNLPLTSHFSNNFQWTTTKHFNLILNDNTNMYIYIYIYSFIFSTLCASYRPLS